MSGVVDVVGYESYGGGGGGGGGASSSGRHAYGNQGSGYGNDLSYGQIAGVYVWRCVSVHACVYVCVSSLMFPFQWR